MGLSMDGDREMVGRLLLAVCTTKNALVGAGPRGCYYVQGYSGRKICDVKIKPSRAQATLLQRSIGAKAVAPQTGSSFNTPAGCPVQAL